MEIIEGHDSRLTALSDNDKIVKDADKLFRFSQEAVEGIIERFEFELTRYLKHLRSQRSEAAIKIKPRMARINGKTRLNFTLLAGGSPVRVMTQQPDS